MRDYIQQKMDQSKDDCDAQRKRPLPHLNMEEICSKRVHSCQHFAMQNNQPVYSEVLVYTKAILADSVKNLR